MKDNAYSRLVGMLKLVLPLAALVLLSTMFLIARQQDPDAALPYAEVEIDELLADPRLTAPTYSGVTSEGDEVIFTAARAYPGAADGTGARAYEPDMRLIGADRQVIQLLAKEARVEPGAQVIILDGGVTVTASKGYALRSETIEAALDHSRLASPVPVEANTPQGHITANSMELTRPSGAGSEVLVFNGQVKLLYQPATPRP